MSGLRCIRCGRKGRWWADGSGREVRACHDHAKELLAATSPQGTTPEEGEARHG
jgi:hypothetical protein